MITCLSLLFLQGPRKEGSDQAVLYVSFLAGCSSGMVASLAVTPFDGMQTYEYLALLIRVTQYSLVEYLYLHLQPSLCM